jgi:hypothetical protein
MVSILLEKKDGRSEGGWRGKGRKGKKMERGEGEGGGGKSELGIGLARCWGSRFKEVAYHAGN